MHVPFRKDSFQGRLCGEIAAALAHRITLLRDDWWPAETPPTGKQGALVYQYSDSSFECAMQALKDHGLLILSPICDPVEGRQLGLYQLAMDADKISDFLADTMPEGDDAGFPLLLEAFLSVFCLYDDLSSERSAFPPPTSLTSVMSMLAQAGYAEFYGRLFTSTAKISPAMRAATLWDENSIPFSEIDEMEAQFAWETMPATLKDRILAGRITFTDIIKTLEQRWRDGHWCEPLSDACSMSRSSDIILARRFIDFADRHREA